MVSRKGPYSRGMDKSEKGERLALNVALRLHERLCHLPLCPVTKKGAEDECPRVATADDCHSVGPVAFGWVQRSYAYARPTNSPPVQPLPQP